MGGAQQFFRVRTWLLAVAAEEGVGIAFQRAALGRDRPLAFAQIAVPGRRSESFHGSCSFRVVDVPQLASVSAPGQTATASIRLPRSRADNVRRSFRCGDDALGE